MKISTLLYRRLFSLSVAGMLFFPLMGGNLFDNFLNPPKGYGNVPFFWWNGDSIELNRLEWELDQLDGSSTDGFSISYIHTHPQVDSIVNANGFGGFGKTDVGSPGVFTDKWWDVFNRFVNLCADRGLGVGIDDYVLGWKNNGFYVDEIMADPSFSQYPGRLHLDSIKNEKGKWEYTVKITSSPELHPDYGKRIIETYFQRCYDKVDTDARKALNYFFQDELSYDLRLDSWSDDMPEQFKRRKGYDIVPHLPALFKDLGKDCRKIRVDYADVLVQLAEERYFRPILKWHEDKGLIYGCDNLGRGLDPVSYLDYFRVTSNFTAPGNDAPARGSSFVQTKVSSSVSHLYNRPRTWLEAFHSMGWDANGQWLTRQLDHHLLAGGNLLCLHGLYYSTHGGWWEWAPPCFHFRMPYWPHMKHWLKYAERMCYLLSQGEHVCDVAVLYPTETFQAYPEARTNKFITLTEKLSSNGIDFDFADSRSLNDAKIINNCLCLGSEQYQALILPDIRILPDETKKIIKNFEKKGGLVIRIDNTEDIDVKNLRDLIKSDFIPLSHPARVLHRRIGNQDIYMVENEVGKENVVEFNSLGRPELWDAFDGSVTPLPVLSCENGVTRLKLPASEASSSLVVFSPGEPDFDNGENVKTILSSELNLDGEWDIRYIPTLNNKFGDFRLPASDEIIGIEAREFEVISPQGQNLGSQVYGFGPLMEMATVDSSSTLDSVLSNVDSLSFSPYFFSWQYGVFDNPGSQGYHGLKGKVEDRFMILDQGGHQIFRTNVFAPETGKYKMVVKGVCPDSIIINSSPIHVSIKNDIVDDISLEKGWNRVIVAYADTPKMKFVLENHNSDDTDWRSRSAVVFYPQNAEIPSPVGPYGNNIAMRWFDSPHLAYDAMPSKDTWTYVFPLAPGTEDFELNLEGSLVSKEIKNQQVIIKAHPRIGYPGAAVFREPVKIKANKGCMPLGNWSEIGPLKFYSGGIAYSKSFDSAQLDNVENVKLSVGEVDATAEVILNGESIGVRMGAPFTIDLSGKIKSGSNLLEIIVYSSLSNHYQTIPSPYRHKARAGLIGPVKILCFE